MPPLHSPPPTATIGSVDAPRRRLQELLGPRAVLLALVLLAGSSVVGSSWAQANSAQTDLAQPSSTQRNSPQPTIVAQATGGDRTAQPSTAPRSRSAQVAASGERASSAVSDLQRDLLAARREARRTALMASIAVFVLAVFVGFEVIAKVPSTLHTPLMSGSNAISGITVVGAIIAAGAGKLSVESILGFCAVILAMINVVGGFVVTHRMLAMFQRR